MLRERRFHYKVQCSCNLCDLPDRGGKNKKQNTYSGINENQSGGAILSHVYNFNITMPCRLYIILNRLFGSTLYQTNSYGTENILHGFFLLIFFLLLMEHRTHKTVLLIGNVDFP